MTDAAASVPYRRAVPLVLASGLLLTAAFPELDLAPLAWVAIAPLLVCVRGAGAGRSFVLGFMFGLAFFASLLTWISIVGYVAWVVLVMLQALFLGLFGSCLGFLTRDRSHAWFVLCSVATWVAVEWARSIVPVVGFTWGELAQSQHDMTWFLQPARWGGGWLVGGWVMLVNASLAVVATSSTWRARAFWLGATLLAFAVPFALPVSSGDGPTLRVAIVQGNVPREFTGTRYEKELVILRSHAELTKGLAGEDVDLVVWPESSVGIDIRRDAVAAREVADAQASIGVPMIIGGNVDIDRDRYQVVAFHLSETGELADTYVKTHLVPFGEYVPWRNLLGWIPMLDQVPRDAVAGNEPGVFEIEGGRVGTAISFEGDFGSVSRRPIAAGANLLVVATNTSTWRESFASAQHVAFSQVRAAENDVWVAHAALSGISAFIDPHGRVVARTQLWEPDVLIREVGFFGGETLYARVGDWFPMLCSALVLVGLIDALRRRRRVRTATVA